MFRRVAAGSHADLLTVERAYDEKRKRMRTQIAVDDVREISDFMSLTPAEGGWRVVVVDGAEELNQNSANALLKVLEEPPPRAVLLLVCAAPGRLLPTIRSRCRRLRLDPLGQETMERLLANYLPDLAADERGRLVTVAEGSPGRALLLAEEEGLAIAGLVDEVLGRAARTEADARLRRGRHARRAARTHFPTSWTCCARGSPRRCATWCAGAPIRSSRGWSRCVPLMPGATCGTR